MGQAPNHPSVDSGAAPPSTGLSPTLSAWDQYYKDASRRRRAAGGSGRHFRVEKRRRRIRERLGVGLAALVVGAMTMIFYLVLR